MPRMPLRSSAICVLTNKIAQDLFKGETVLYGYVEFYGTRYGT